mmetsp:Transcript_64170/g.184407  ORF Transcript_64170/g.184407 Transcript_64170/m.184407 type:complete len:236 (-) Transcript_64170:8-715(-)
MAAVADTGDGFAFWKMPMPDEDGLDPAAEEAAAAEKKPAEVAHAAPPPVAWPPARPADLGEPDAKAGQSAAVGKTGRNKNRGAGDKGGAGGGHKREDGWLPKAEYEAKKREERARRQREREQQQQQANSADRVSVGAAGATGDGQGRRGRRGRDTWQDIQMTLPKRPEPVEETAEHRAKREAEEARLRCRDQLRSATTTAALQEAIAVAKELGLTDEVKLAEKKLARMDSAGGAA